MAATPVRPRPLGPPWDEWGQIGRFLESAQLALARERSLWSALEIARPEDVSLAGSAQPSRRKVRLEQHLAALATDEPLLAAALVHSYALTESYAARRLCSNARSFTGIEDWGTRLLTDAGRSWADVRGGLPGAVEVAVMRNAFAHGVRIIHGLDEDRLRRAGVRSRQAGDRVTLSDDECREFRARLSSLMTASMGR